MESPFAWEAPGRAPPVLPSMPIHRGSRCIVDYNAKNPGGNGGWKGGLTHSRSTRWDGRRERARTSDLYRVKVAL